MSFTLDKMCFSRSNKWWSMISGRANRDQAANFSTYSTLWPVLPELWTTCRQTRRLIFSNNQNSITQCFHSYANRQVCRQEAIKIPLKIKGFTCNSFSGRSGPNSKSQVLFLVPVPRCPRAGPSRARGRWTAWPWRAERERDSCCPRRWRGRRWSCDWRTRPE